MSKVETARRPTFRLALGITTVVGISVEFSNPINSGVNLEFRRFNVWGNAATQHIGKRRSAAATGGTPAAVVAVGATTDDVSATACRTFSTAPTGGTLVDTVFNTFTTTNQFIGDALEALDLQPIIVKPGQVLTIEHSVAVSAFMNFLWAETPV